MKSLDRHRHVVRLQTGHLVFHLLDLLLSHRVAKPGPFVKNLRLTQSQLVDLKCQTLG